MTERRREDSGRRLKAVLASMFAGLIVVLFLVVSIHRDIRALSRETRARAVEAQLRWDLRRTAGEARDKVLHDEILGELTELTAELRLQREGLERLRLVTPVQAIRDRAGAGR